MVNRGRSGGCVTCKKAHVKCDEAKPNCRRCIRLGLSCGGYKAERVNLKFKDQNHLFERPLVSGQVVVLARDGDTVSGPLRQLAVPDTAVPFFLGLYASIGRNLGSARGFFEMLIPVYNSQRSDSAIALAVSAVASEILNLWRHGPQSCRNPQKAYSQAIVRLRHATKDPIERCKPATVFAVLALQLYENIAAVYGFRFATGIHHNGAMSLLPFIDPNALDDQISVHVRSFLLHEEVSAAIRQKRPLDSIAYSWLESRDMAAFPINASSKLDVIGMSVAELQAEYIALTMQDSSTVAWHQAMVACGVKAKLIDEQFETWAQNVPSHWLPLQLRSGKDIDLSIPTYQFVCDVYPSCQIACIWNLWHLLRLLLLKIRLGSSNILLCRGRDEVMTDPISSGIEDLVECRQTIQNLVDSVCYSVPYYLGNRARPSSLDDFDDPILLFPSYHSLDKDDERLLKQNSKLLMSKDEHKRHMVARGPWQAMSPLSRLLTMFAESDGQLLANALRPGQYKWISEQFLRVTNLLELRPAKEEDAKSSIGLLQFALQDSIDGKAEYLASEVRKGAIFMSGP